MLLKIIVLKQIVRSKKEHIERSKLYRDLSAYILRLYHEDGDNWISYETVYVYNYIDPRAPFEASFGIDHWNRVYLLFGGKRFYTFNKSLAELIAVESSWHD